MRTNREHSLNPTPGDRLRALLAARLRPPALMIRRLVAIGLVVAAAVLALRTADGNERASELVVTARDLPPGMTLTAADLALRRVPAGFLPSGSLTSMDAAVGRVLAGAARAGEPLTDVRLVGPANTELITGTRDAAEVPVRLSDPEVADLLHPGSRVDVVALDDNQSTRQQVNLPLARDAIVVTIRNSDSTAGHHGRLVVLALPRSVAIQVAMASLQQPVAVTLH